MNFYIFPMCVFLQNKKMLRKNMARNELFGILNLVERKAESFFHSWDGFWEYIEKKKDILNNPNNIFLKQDLNPLPSNFTAHSNNRTNNSLQVSNENVRLDRTKKMRQFPRIIIRLTWGACIKYVRNFPRFLIPS